MGITAQRKSETQNTETGTEAGTIVEIAGDLPTSPEDESYDYTETVITEQSSVTVTTEEITVTENVELNESDLTHVQSETDPTATNDLITEIPSAAENTEIPEAVDGYGYSYVGTDNTSQFRPAVVFTEPLTDEEMVERFGDKAYILATQISSFPTDQAVSDGNGGYVTDAEGYLLDSNGNRILKAEKTVVSPEGETYYLHRIDPLGTVHNVEGWYQDGVWLEELNGDKYGVVYATSQQFILVDQTTGELVTVYCADINTPAADGFGYNIENLEDAAYYTDEQAEKIRTIAEIGYWGTEAGKVGSLESMKEMLRAAVDADGNRIFTDDEINNSLTDGVAMTATQMAIWSCSNHMAGAEFINTHYIGTPDITEINGGGTTSMKNVPADKVDEAMLMFKVYDYLRNLTPKAAENTTADTIINADNFLKELSLTVVEKAEDHENNRDNDDTNDAYVTDLTFALVVTPSTENGDDLIVKVLDANGRAIAEGRVAGQVQGNEQMLFADDNGNYTFSGITLVEGDQNFNITLEGIQNLKEGVYLYTSEVRTEADGSETSSQTMVGLASGQREVNVEMNIRFELNVEDEVVVRERYWRRDREDEEPEEKKTEEEIPEEEIPEEEIPEEDVPKAELPEEPAVEIPDAETPLANVPLTGATFAPWAMMSLLSGMGLVIVGRKREE